MASYTFDSAIERDVQDALKPRIDGIISRAIDKAQAEVVKEMRKAVAEVAVKISVETQHYDLSKKIVIELRLPDQDD